MIKELISLNVHQDLASKSMNLYYDYVTILLEVEHKTRSNAMMIVLVTGGIVLASVGITIYAMSLRSISSFKLRFTWPFGFGIEFDKSNVIKNHQKGKH